MLKAVNTYTKAYTQTEDQLYSKELLRKITWVNVINISAKKY